MATVTNLFDVLLRKANNLSDLPSVVTARTNLGVGVVGKNVSTTPYTVLATDLCLYVDTTAQDIYVNLPACTNNETFHIFNASGANKVYVVPNGTDQIDGVNATFMLYPGEILDIAGWSANWRIQ